MQIKNNFIIPIELKNLLIVADFDKTITEGDSPTSWSILAKSGIMPEEYTKKRDELFLKYHPIEISNDVGLRYKKKMMKKWFKKHLNLLIKFKCKEDDIIKASSVLGLKIRKGFKEFAERLNANNVPIIIISAGIGNFIEIALKKNDCLYPNITILSNVLKFKNGICTKLNKKIIHTLNKDVVSLPKDIAESVKNINSFILLGDQLADLNMIKENAIKICYLNNETKNDQILKDAYDVICEVGEDYDSLSKTLFR